MRKGSILQSQRGAGTFVGAQGVTRDSAEQKPTEEEKEKPERRLRSSREMGATRTLSKSIAHDFNNILGAIVGYAELAQDCLSKGDTHIDSHLDEVIKATDRARNLLTQVFSVSRKTDT